MENFPDKSGGAGQLPPGSARPPGRGPKPAAVVSGASKARRPFTRRFRDAVFTASPKNLTGQIGRDIVLPQFKHGLQAALNGFINGILWGNVGQSPLGRQHNITRSYTGYGNQYSPNAPTNTIQQAQNSVVRNSGNYEDVICPSEEAATRLLSQALNYIQQYNVMAVGDLYDMAELPTSVSDHAYGWTSIEGARIVQTIEGFELKMPRPGLLN